MKRNFRDMMCDFGDKCGFIAAIGSIGMCAIIFLISLVAGLVEVFAML